MRKTLLTLALALFASLALALSLSACMTYYEGPESDHFDGTQFHNHGAQPDLPYARILWEVITAPHPPWPESETVAYDKPPKRVPGAKMRVAFVGHASVLIQTQNLNILTDPVWSERASPVSWAGPKRSQKPGIKLNDLPPIDIILVSHNHYDHMDLETIAALWQRDKPLIFAPLGNDRILANYDERIKAIAMDWGDSQPIAAQMEIALEPMFHWSTRWGAIDRNKALWGAFVIKTPSGAIYFVGDSGFGNGRYYKEAKQKYGAFRLAILPIGTYKPRWFFNYHHQDPSQAVEAHQILNAFRSMGVHFGTFDLSLTPYDEPAQSLRRALAKENLGENVFRALKPGDIWWIPTDDQR